jgi:predicted ribonuclease YlaK
MLHDSSVSISLDEHDIVVTITVLEELEKFIKGIGSLNFHHVKPAAH